MAKNLMYEICKMLGVELFEEFKVVHKTGFEIICNFTKEGLFVHKGYSGKYEKELLADIICGKVEIVKLPWKWSMSYDHNSDYFEAGERFCNRQSQTSWQGCRM